MFIGKYINKFKNTLNYFSNIYRKLPKKIQTASLSSLALLTAASLFDLLMIFLLVSRGRESIAFNYIEIIIFILLTGSIIIRIYGFRKTYTVTSLITSFFAGKTLKNLLSNFSDINKAKAVDISKTIIGDTDTANKLVIYNFFLFISSLGIVFCLLLGLFIISFRLGFLVLFIAIVFGLPFGKLFLNSTRNISRNNSLLEDSIIKELTSLLMASEELTAYKMENQLSEKISTQIRNLTNGVANVQNLSALPRIILDSGYTIVFVLSSLFISIKGFSADGSNKSISIIISILCLQRLLSSSQQLMSSYLNMVGYKYSFIKLTKDYVQFPNKIKSDSAPTKLSIIKNQEITSSKQFKTLNIYDFLNLSNLNFLNFKPLFKEINLIPGSILVIRGRTGLGKSSLLKELIKYILLTNESEDISYCPQNPYIVDSDILTNIVWPYFVNNISDEKKIRVQKLINDFNLEHLKKETQKKWDNTFNTDNLAIYPLSGGERRRIAFLRSISRDSKYYFFDEPSSSLDTNTSNIIKKEILKLSNRRKIVFMVSHNEELIKLGTRILTLDK